MLQNTIEFPTDEELGKDVKNIVESLTDKALGVSVRNILKSITKDSSDLPTATASSLLSVIKVFANHSKNEDNEAHAMMWEELIKVTTGNTKNLIISVPDSVDINVMMNRFMQEFNSPNHRYVYCAPSQNLLNEMPSVDNVVYKSLESTIAGARAGKLTESDFKGALIFNYKMPSPDPLGKNKDVEVFERFYQAWKTRRANSHTPTILLCSYPDTWGMVESLKSKSSNISDEGVFETITVDSLEWRHLKTSEMTTP